MTSIRDIARMAGVSPASVSRILNNDMSFSINENTRKRVIEIANRVHYSKNKSKPGPRSKSDEMSIGLILRHTSQTELTDPYFRNIHQGIDEEAAKWRLRTETIFTMHEKDKDWDSIAKYGAIIVEGEMTTEAIRKIRSLNSKVILVDVSPDSGIADCTHICNDFSLKTRQILDYLYKLGHRNIAFIGGRSSMVNAAGKTIYKKIDEREKAYCNWMKLHNLEKYIHSFIGSWGTEEGLELSDQMLQLKDRPTAVIVGSDPMALGVYKSLSNHGISIPDDISVVSFDDVEMNRFLTPTLSSVYLDSNEMGKLAVRLAKDMIIETVPMNFTVICHSKLNVRDSIAKK